MTYNHCLQTQQTPHDTGPTTAATPTTTDTHAGAAALGSCQDDQANPGCDATKGTQATPKANSAERQLQPTLDAREDAILLQPVGVILEQLCCAALQLPQES